MKIRALLAESPNDSQYHWRIDTPFMHLRQYNIDAKTISTTDDVDEDTDIAILPKMYVRKEDREDICEFFESLQAQNTLVVYDADDDMWSESFVQYMIQMHYKREHGPQILHAIIEELEQRRAMHLWTVMQCDAVMVSTSALGQYIRKITEKPTFVVPNAISVDAFTQQIDPDQALTHPHYVTVGWAGGSRPLSDLSPMLEAWNRLICEKDNVKFVISGWMPPLDDYPNLMGKVIHVPWTSVSEYANGMQVDIGCVCVGDTDFSRRKSPIKAWEFSLAGAMVVGSESLYGEEPIVSCKDASDWYRVLKFYVDNSEAREAFAEAYKKHVLSFNDMKYNWLYWADAYSKIINTLGARSERTVVPVS